MVFCSKCGTQLNEGVEFCKNCGSNVKAPQSNYLSINTSILNKIFGRLNNKINLTGVYAGLAISLLVLIIAPVSYSLFVVSGAFGIIGLLYLVLLTMMLLGGFSTSILCCKTYSEGIANGGFLGLVAIINLGFLIGAFWFAAIAVISQIASMFSPFGSSDSSGSSFLPDTSSSSSTAASGSYLPIAEIIALPFLMIIMGIIGGLLGVFIKKLFKNNM